MFGVITEVRVHPDREEEARAMVIDVILPKAKGFPGFLSGQWLRALEGDVLRAALIFDTEANALATASKIRSVGPPPGAPVTLHSVDAYELIAQDRWAASHCSRRSARRGMAVVSRHSRVHASPHPPKQRLQRVTCVQHTQHVRWRWRNLPLPENHIGGLAAAILLHRLVPQPLVPRRLGHFVGWPLLAAGAAIVGGAVHAAEETDVEAPERLVAEGPAHSRNPMYLAWTLLYAGTSLELNNSWPLRLLPLVLGKTHAVVLREERDLEARFGTSYRSYKATVQRYL